MRTKRRSHPAGLIINLAEEGRSVVPRVGHWADHWAGPNAAGQPAEHWVAEHWAAEPADG